MNVRLLKTLLAAAVMAMLMLGGLFALFTAVVATAVYCAVRSTFRSPHRAAMPSGRSSHEVGSTIDVDATEIASEPAPAKRLPDGAAGES